MSTALVILAAVVVALYLLARWNRTWVYRLFDRALENDRKNLPERYELPRYFTLDHGKVDVAARWRGWDGWYFSMFPDEKTLPLRMIRGSLMTGLYGLDGIDNYAKLPLDLSTFGAAEYFTLAPTLERVNGRFERENFFSHHYLPKAAALSLDHRTLDVSLSGRRVVPDETTERYGHISGRWPRYRFEIANPEADLKATLDYDGKDILWWADTPFFTYFAAFGSFSGEVVYKYGTQRTDPYDMGGKPETYRVSGKGFFEHGFARKPFNFDKLFLPVQGVKAIAPSFKPIRYHYELFVGDDGHHGGFMKARGFGIDFRNHGGIYRDDVYRPIERIAVDYGEKPSEEVRNHCGERNPASFPKRWRVHAKTASGFFDYVAEREFPPALVATNLIYYTFNYEGSFEGKHVSGRGYGEYLNL